MKKMKLYKKNFIFVVNHIDVSPFVIIQEHAPAHFKIKVGFGIKMDMIQNMTMLNKFKLKRDAPKLLNQELIDMRDSAFVIAIIAVSKDAQIVAVCAI